MPRSKKNPKSTSLFRSIERKIYPTKKQEKTILYWTGIAENIWNQGLDLKRTAWEKDKKNISLFDLFKMLTKFRRETASIESIPLSYLRSPLINLDKAFKAFFQRCKRGEKPGYPRHKHNRLNSISYEATGNYLRNTSIFVPGLGLIKSKGNRQVEGTQKILRLIHRPSGWYAQITVELTRKPAPRVMPSKTIGLDMGLIDFITDSHGNSISHPKFVKKQELRLKHLDREISRKRKGSKNRLKARTRRNRLYERLKNQGKDFCHKLSKDIIADNDLISIEDLNLKQMEDRAYKPLRKSLSHSMIPLFFFYLSYKAEEAGKTVVKVDPRNTSKECSRCGFLVEKSLSDRWHSCPQCGLEMPRDHNSAIIVEHRGIEQYNLTEGNPVIACGEEELVKEPLRSRKSKEARQLVFEG